MPTYPHFLIRFKYDDVRGTIGTCRADEHHDKGDVIYGQHGRAIVTHCHHVVPVVSKMIITARGAVTCRA